jgi:hypothetical protein
MAKHPRTFVPSSDTSSSYGDGGFFFTQPVGAGGGYADGGFFFTQPVGAGGGYAGPNRAARRAGFVHPAYAGAGGYGAAPKVGGALKSTFAAGSLKGGGLKTAGAASGDNTGTGIADKPATKKAAATASADVVKKFEEAYIALGEKQFWRDYWEKAKRAAGSKFSTTSEAEKKGWDDAYNAALKTANDASTALLAGMPPFPVRESGALAGMPTGPAADALSAYRGALIDKGMLKQAFRKVSGSKRDPAQPLIDAILRDIRDPMMKEVFTSTSEGTKVWELRSNPNLDTFMSAMSAYVINDPASAWAIDKGDWGTKWWEYARVEGRAGNVGGRAGNPSKDKGGPFRTLPSSSKTAINVGTTLDDDFWSNDDRKKVARSYVSWRLLKKFFTDKRNTEIKSARTPWETKSASNPAAVETTRKNWENARKTFVETARTAEQLTIEQKNNALTAKNKASQAETAFDKTRDFAATALSARQGAEGGALVADLASTERYAADAGTAANNARAQSDAALRLAQEVTSLAARAGGLATADKERADAASVSAERSANDARDSFDAATAQITVAQAALSVKQAEEAANAAAANVVQADAAAVDAVATAQGAQAAADAAKGAADRAAAGVANGTVSAAVAEAALREYERLQAIATAANGTATAEQQKAANIKAEADRIEALAAAERDRKDEITKDVFTPGEQEPGRLKKTVGRDMVPVPQGGFLSKYKTPILVTVLLGGAALAWHFRRSMAR